MQFAVQTDGCILKKIMFLHFLQWKLVATILYSPFEWNSYVIHDWAYLQQRNDSQTRDLFSGKSLTLSWCIMQQSYPHELCSLFVVCFHSFPLPLWAMQNLFWKDQTD